MANPSATALRLRRISPVSSLARRCPRRSIKTRAHPTRAGCSTRRFPDTACVAAMDIDEAMMRRALQLAEEAAERLGGWRLLETTLYVTLEPCAMCAGAITLARVPRLVYGAADPKGGAVGSVIDLFAEPVVNHRPSVEGGLLADRSAALLESFFTERR